MLRGRSVTEHMSFSSTDMGHIIRCVVNAIYQNAETKEQGRSNLLTVGSQPFPPTLPDGELTVRACEDKGILWRSEKTIWDPYGSSFKRPAVLDIFARPDPASRADRFR